jgi:hypothetical protein
LGFRGVLLIEQSTAGGEGQGERLILGVYIADLVITVSRKQDVLKFKKQMERHFKMIDLGLLHYYLGIEVKQQTGGPVLTQAAYAKKIPKKAGMVDCNSCKAPMEPGLKLSKESTSPLVDATFCRSPVGSLRYLINIRPDFAFVVGYVSRFMQKTHTDHLATLITLLL